MRSYLFVRLLTVSALQMAALAIGFVPSVAAQSPSDAASLPEVSQSTHHDVSPALRDIPTSPTARRLTERPLRQIGVPNGASQVTPDPVLQKSATSPLAATVSAGFAGVGNGDYGFAPNAAPPDTNLAVGATQIVQWVNES
ncbi:MAG TPA: hypothetical protein VGK87_03270, partial [Anaerolineae bacterium]